MVTTIESTAHEKPVVLLSDYSLIGQNTKKAIEQGLAEADWYQSPVERQTMRQLLQRRDGPAIRDTIIWFGLLAIFGYLGFHLWGSWWAILPFAIYGVIYGSTSDSRWHESLHGTAFKTDWLNIALYEIASFMVMRESTVWRWSHTRHHSDTIIVGRDPEIVSPRPPSITNLLLGFFAIPAAIGYWKKILLHVTGRLNPEEATFIPPSAHRTVYFKARIYFLIYAGVIAACFYKHTMLPLMFIGLPNFYGAWLMPIYGYTQHAGLAENVLDHRLNCRTVYMNFVHRYLYWNMNYHVEHHMFPLVPYHQLPRLHKLVRQDMPTPYRNLFHAWCELVPAVLRQVKDPGFYVKRELPTPSQRSAANVASKTIVSTAKADEQGWIEVGKIDILDQQDVLRLDHDQHTYAIYRTSENTYYATDGFCTHGNTHLATGWVRGDVIECPKHNGRFDVRDGSPKRPPACVSLRTYPVRLSDGRVFVNIKTAGGAGARQEETTYQFRVVSNQNVATFIRELVLEPAENSPRFEFKPGQYLQLNIPAYGSIAWSQLEVQSPYDAVWKAQHVFDYVSENHTQVRRNYSLAGNPHSEKQLRFNVRIVTPPRGQKCNAGVGSAYVWNLKPGDHVSAIGPFGDFLIKETQNEMVYIGGGAGMAPLRSHLAYLFETLNTGRKVSFWYGARSRQEIFYQDYFESIKARFPNFNFHIALSEPLPSDQWSSHAGYIHEVLRHEYLSKHPAPRSIEYYLCGPPAMIQATRKMLDEIGVEPAKIAYDEF